MPICPNCKTEQKRRRNSKCPNCHVHVECYKPRGKNSETLWVYETSNTTELVQMLELLISENIGEPFRFENRLPELGMARTLYEKCGYNQSLAAEVIFIYFDPLVPRSKIWTKYPKSMSTVLWDSVAANGKSKGCFSMALAIARGRQRIKEERLKQLKLEI